MRLSKCFAIAAFVLAGCASTPPEMAIINDAADALGGAAMIQSVNTLTIEGTGENVNFGQNASPDTQGPILNVTQYKRTLDFAGNRWRLEQIRVPTVGNTAAQTQILAVDGDVAFNVNPQTMAAARQNAQVAKDRQAELYHHPIGALRAALAEGAVVSNPRKDGNDDVVDIAAGGTTVTLYVDATSKMPSKVRTTTDNVNGPLGDVVIETAFADYSDTGGVQLPGRLTTKTDKITTADIQVSSNTANGEVGDLAAPADVAAAQVPGVFVANLTDITVEEAGTGLWYLRGPSHHSVLAEFSDHLVLVEAPQSVARTEAVIAKVKELRPAKPIRYVINTHHHFDHSGGIRAVMAEGATIITHEGNKAFLEEVASRPHTLSPDALSQNPKPATVEGVTEKRVLQDAMRTLEIYPVTGSAHSDTMLMVYFPAERLIVEADLYNPPAPPAANAPPAPPPVFPFAANFVENVQKNGLQPARIMPIHGRIVPFRDAQTARGLGTD
jgi:glyoxylase-like metal-dependent hydrolase (beta-lactamase superfamily II)